MNAPSIDSELLKFSEINISEITATVNSLKEKMVSLDSANSEILSSLPNVFSSDAGKEAMSQLSSLKDTCVIIKNSVDTELTEILNKSTTLIEGINNLKAMLTELNNLIANAPIKYREEDDGKGGTTKVEDGRDYTEATKYLNEKFKPEEERLKQELIALKNIDSTLSILSTYAEAGSVMFDLSGKYLDGIYEIDGVYYQVVSPTTKQGTFKMDQHYIITYDTGAIFAALGDKANKEYKDGVTYKEYILSVLNQSVTTQKSPAVIWNMHSNNYTNDEKEIIATVFNSVLKSTYVANNASTIADYTALSGLTATNSIFKLGYGDSGNACGTVGASSIVASGRLDCIEFVKWTAYQGVSNYYKDNPVMQQKAQDNIMSGDLTCVNYLSYHSVSPSSMSAEELASLAPGTVLSKQVPDNYHVGVVVGTGTDNSGNKVVLVSQAAEHSSGTIISSYTPSELAENWGGVTTAQHAEERYTASNEKSIRIRNA